MSGVVPKVAFSDIRGKLIEVVKSGDWKQLNHLFTTKDGVRGNHYHKVLRELFYILKGTMKIDLLNVNTQVSESVVLKQGECYIVEPYELHTMTAVEETEMISMYSEVFDESNPDLYRVDGAQQK